MTKVLGLLNNRGEAYSIARSENCLPYISHNASTSTMTCVRGIFCDAA